MINDEQHFKLVSWPAIRQQVSRHNPHVAHEIDNIRYNNRIKLLLVSIPYGAIIVQHGQFHIYCQNQSIPFYDQRIAHLVQDTLGYHKPNFPLAMLIQNTTEAFIDYKSHIMPIHTQSPGDFLPLVNLDGNKRKKRQDYQMYSATAGARSLITLPKLSHQLYNNNLAKYYQYEAPPVAKDFHMQWPIFRKLAQSENFERKWHTQMVIFPASLLEKLSSLPEFIPLKHRLYQQLWRHQPMSFQQTTFDVAWSLYTNELTTALRHNPYLIETAKHLIKIALGLAPGYTPAIEDNQAPIKNFYKSLVHVYKIRYYHPIFMQAQVYDGQRKVYYSLHKQTMNCALPPQSNSKRTIEELVHIKAITKGFIHHIAEKRFHFPLHESELFEKLKHTDFTFYHPQGNEALNGNIQEIHQQDERFHTISGQMKNHNNLRFPDHSSFFKGCVRIQPKQQQHNKPKIGAFLMPLKQKISL